MSAVIKVESLSKRYLIGHQKQAGYQTFRETLSREAKRALKAPLEWMGLAPTEQRGTTEEFWALKDVTFEVNDGDRLGIIGRNGAGKSTLLKVLSRITEPSKGKISIKGRMASLLEVGTGFHPELTGRENIYLNGAILGMSRAEVQRKFDQIVSFAEVERFLDTPVKRYSSGMYVRLAFAVAAHLEPEILIVDEVLAVGDVAFQKKCMSHMNEIGTNGRTVLFVSHNLGAIEQLCNSVVCLGQGKLLEHSYDVSGAIRNYMSEFGAARVSEWRNEKAIFRNEWFEPAHFYVGDENGASDPRRTIGVNERIYIYVEGFCKNIDPALQIGIALYTENSDLLFWSFSTDDQNNWPKTSVGKNTFRLEMPGYLLNEGVYRVELGIALYHRSWICEPGKNSPGISLEIRGGFLASSYWSERRVGFLAPVFSWERME